MRHLTGRGDGYMKSNLMGDYREKGMPPIGSNGSFCGTEETRFRSHRDTKRMKRTTRKTSYTMASIKDRETNVF